MVNGTTGVSVDLRTFRESRGITQAGAAVLASVDAATISRIEAGQVQARPTTIVKLARALGVKATRMQAMCEAHWAAAHPDEVLRAS